MQIAIASTDGQTVNEHFGRTSKFLIYEATPSSFNLVGEKEVKAYATGQENHTFDNERLQVVAQALAGCDKVFVTKIGAEPATALKEAGITPVVYSGSIRDINL